ncbi:MAG: hypothetical protein EOO56_09020 [Hymenobacter sp.]|nr:MAG: hypothetical protein EOO56_09020 [Hymenobacter sp.]
MIAEKERNEVLTTLVQTQNEELFQQILLLVRQRAEPQLPQQQIAPPGYAAGAGFWMADDFDEPLKEMLPYMY